MSDVILVVDDDRELASSLEYNLDREGYRPRVVHSATEALELIARGARPDLVLLELVLPDVPGTEVCRTLRAADETRRVPVVILSARGDEIDRVVGFELGADDYVVKPFSMRELLLRIRAVLRRARMEPLEAEVSELVHEKLRVDPQAHRVWCDEEDIELTPLEFRLLTTLLSRRGRVQTREVLLSDVWGMEVEVHTRTVDTQVKRLREKLGAAGAYIETVRGVGYRFAAGRNGG